MPGYKVLVLLFAADVDRDIAHEYAGVATRATDPANDSSLVPASHRLTRLLNNLLILPSWLWLDIF